MIHCTSLNNIYPSRAIAEEMGSMTCNTSFFPFFYALSALEGFVLKWKDVATSERPKDACWYKHVCRWWKKLKRQKKTRDFSLWNDPQTGSTSVKLQCTLENQVCTQNAYVCTHGIPLAMSVSKKGLLFCHTRCTYFHTRNAILLC